MRRHPSSVRCRAIAAIAFLLTLVASPTRAAEVIEYYHAGLDHYFVTRFANEIQALDSGTLRGWMRTGQSFQVFDAGDARLGGSLPVCRFYGNPARGLDSHFYSLPAECAEVKVRFAADWLLESDDVMRVHPVDSSGQCPANTKAVYRLYNRRSDVNHRYTTDTSVVEVMVAKGYLLEGVGSPRPVVFCAANDAATVEAPACTLTASSTSLTVSSTLTLTATCTNGPTVYTWTGCASNTNVCATSESTVGARTYTVTARNAAGVGSAASLNVAWQASVTGPPVCTLSTSPTSPFAGSTTTLTANCSQSPTSYGFVGCSEVNGNLCRASNATTGAVTYSVTASNALGSSAPASITLNWQTPPPPGADFCGSYSEVRRFDLIWGAHINTNDPGGGFKADGVLVGRLVVPSNASGTSIPGVVSAVEFAGNVVPRTMSLATSACDFRGFEPGVFPTTDPTGANKPIAWGFGVSPNTQFGLAGMSVSAPKLIPGQIYYVNIRNREYSNGQLTCSSEECNMRITVSEPK